MRSCVGSSWKANVHGCGMRFEYAPGATPIDPDEAKGLIPAHLTLQRELNESCARATSLHSRLQMLATVSPF